MTARRGAMLATLAVMGLVCAGPVRAQMVLPGAVAPTPEGASQIPAPASHPKAKARPEADSGTSGSHDPKGTAVPVPSVTALNGRTLTQNGAGSQIVFGPADNTVAVARLTMTGEKISNALDTCRVESSSTTLPLGGLGRPNGLERYRVDFPACPIEFDVLDGAILVGSTQASCDFTAADCRIRPAGLWGPVPADLGADRVKTLERARAASESAVRSNFKALTASTKDRPTIMGFAHDQAQFSSSREETCRDYADEGRHGYCAAKLTEARAALLYDRLGTALAEKAARKAAKDAKRHGGRKTT